MRLRPLAWMGFLCCLAPWTAAMADDGPRFEIAPFVAYRAGGKFDLESTASDTGQSVDLGDGAGFGLGLGLYRDRESFYELLYSRQQAGLDSRDPALRGVDVRVEYYHFGGTVLFPQQREWLVPYLSLTLGATRLSATGGHYDSETKLSASLGTGLRLAFNDHVSANLGLRGYVTLLDSDTEFLCVSDAGGATCLLKSSGSTLFQGEANLGVTLRF